jgi:hypothetical protein
MEDYLKEDYGVIEDEYLTDETKIVSFFKDYAYEDFDCGQGYYQEENTYTCKIDDKFYQVYVLAEIGSSKQDRGERLYWVEDIKKVEYREIPKPTPKRRVEISLMITTTKEKYYSLKEFMESHEITFKENELKNEKDIL